MAQDKEFLIHCPLGLPPRDQIVALCAITDWNDDASPCEDGWFVSDFYLFHHPMSPRGKKDQVSHVYLSSSD